jgi:hypothetical protein
MIEATSMTPVPTSRVDRGYTSFIRLESFTVSPFRRATEAGNVVLSSPGIPTRITRPPGLAA